jgi:hypothetical protein
MHQLGEYGRNFVFWHYDRVRGGKVWKHLQDINHIFHSPNLVKKHQDERLKEPLNYVTVNVPYYYDWYRRKILRNRTKLAISYGIENIIRHAGKVTSKV